MHDLDLCLTHSEGGSPICGGANGELDTLNTVERVRLDQPRVGRWTVSVKSNALPYGNQVQAFALIITSEGGVVKVQ